MSNISYTKTIKKNWEVIALLVGFAVIASLVYSLFQPFQYRASTELLVIQSQASSLDAYTATKSAEKIGRNLSQVVSSTSFYNDVVRLDSDVAGYFPADDNERREAWEEDITMNVIPETGVLELSAYHEEPEIASQLIESVSFVLVNMSEKYHGGGENVSIRMIDDVFVSSYPVRPNLPLNIAIAVVLGFVIGSMYVLSKEAYRIREYHNADEDDDSMNSDSSDENSNIKESSGLNLHKRELEYDDIGVM